VVSKKLPKAENLTANKRLRGFLNLFDDARCIAYGKFYPEVTARSPLFVAWLPRAHDRGEVVRKKLPKARCIAYGKFYPEVTARSPLFVTWLHRAQTSLTMHAVSPTANFQRR
jgi:hypothetical protein